MSKHHHNLDDLDQLSQQQEAKRETRKELIDALAQKHVLHLPGSEDEQHDVFSEPQEIQQAEANYRPPHLELIPRGETGAPMPEEEPKAVPVAAFDAGDIFRLQMQCFDLGMRSWMALWKASFELFRR